MKIISIQFLNAVFHSSNDLYGASKIMLQVVDILIKEGYEIHVFLPYNGPLNEILEVKKIKLNILNFGVLRRKYFNFFGIIIELIPDNKSSYLAAISWRCLFQSFKCFNLTLSIAA